MKKVFKHYLLFAVALTIMTSCLSSGGEEIAKPVVPSGYVGYPKNDSIKVSCIRENEYIRKGYVFTSDKLREASGGILCLLKNTGTTENRIVGEHPIIKDNFSTSFMESFLYPRNLDSIAVANNIDFFEMYITGNDADFTKMNISCKYKNYDEELKYTQISDLEYCFTMKKIVDAVFYVNGRCEVANASTADIEANGTYKTGVEYENKDLFIRKIAKDIVGTDTIETRVNSGKSGIQEIKTLNVVSGDKKWSVTVYGNAYSN